MSEVVLCRKRDASGRLRYEPIAWKMELYYEFELENMSAEEIDDDD